MRTFWPPLFREPPLRRCVIGEHAEKLCQREPLAVGFSGCLVCHVSASYSYNIVPKTDQFKGVSALFDIIPFIMGTISNSAEGGNYAETSGVRS